jgi:hypothetical protein
VIDLLVANGARNFWKSQGFVRHMQVARYTCGGSSDRIYELYGFSKDHETRRVSVSIRLLDVHDETVPDLSRIS